MGRMSAEPSTMESEEIEVKRLKLGIPSWIVVLV
jgi:hypothetical protein